jgi:pilus assembly protein Flp/PilA
MANFARRFRRDSSGATAIEYALIAAFIAVAIAVAVTALGAQVSALIQSAANAFP